MAAICSDTGKHFMSLLTTSALMAVLSHENAGGRALCYLWAWGYLHGMDCTVPGTGFHCSTFLMGTPKDRPPDHEETCNLAGSCQSSLVVWEQDAGVAARSHTSKLVIRPKISLIVRHGFENQMPKVLSPFGKK